MYTNEFLQAFRNEIDTEADQVITRLISGFSVPEVSKWIHQSTVLNSKMPSELRDFMEFTIQIPNWTNLLLLRKATSFFYQYTETIMMLLGTYSLPYCYAGADGARLLHLSEKIRKNIENRLMETARFTFVICSKGAFDHSESPGWKEIKMIRLRHAFVRAMALKSGKWDPSWGAPVNMEDMAATNLAFSFLILEGMKKMGIAVDKRSQEAWVHHWAFIGNLMKIPEELTPRTLQGALQLKTAVERHQFKESTHGKELTQDLLDHFQSKFGVSGFQLDWVKAFMRYLMEDEVADMLGIRISNIIDNNKDRIFRVRKWINTYKLQNGNYEKVQEEIMNA